MNEITNGLKEFYAKDISAKHAYMFFLALHEGRQTIRTRKDLVLALQGCFEYIRFSLYRALELA